MTPGLESSLHAGNAAAASGSQFTLSAARGGASSPRPNALEPPLRRFDPARKLAVLTMLARRAQRLVEDSGSSTFADELALLRSNNVAAFLVADLLDVAAKALFGPGPAGVLAGLPSGLLEDLARRTKDLVRAGIRSPEAGTATSVLDALRFLIAMIGNARSLGEGFAAALLPGYDGLGGFPGFQATDFAELPRGRHARPLSPRDVKSALLARLRTIDTLTELLHCAILAPECAPLECAALENELAEFATVKRRLGDVLLQAMAAEQATNDAILRRLEL